jgi:hypothetical protein
MNAGKVGLGQFNQLIFILADDGFAARTRNVCLHTAAFPSGDLLLRSLGSRFHLLLV